MNDWAGIARMVVTVVMLALGASDVSVTVAVGTPCIELKTFERGLKANGLRVRENASTSVQLSGANATLVVVGHAPNRRPLQRTVPADARECAAVQRITATLIRAWLDSPPLSTPVDPRPTSARSEAAAPSVQAPAIALGSPQPGSPQLVSTTQPGSLQAPASAQLGSTHDGLRQQLGSTAQPLELAQPPRTALVVTERVAHAVSADAGIAEGPSAQLEAARSGEGGERFRDAAGTAPEPDRRATWVFRVGALGGAASGPTASVAPIGSLFVDATRLRWGFGLEFGLAGDRSVARAGGTVWASSQWLTAYGRVQWSPVLTVGLEAFIGLRGLRFAAASVRYSNPLRVDVYGFGGVAGVGASWHLWGPLLLLARATLAVRSREEAFVVENVGTVLTLRVWELSALLGVGAQL